MHCRMQMIPNTLVGRLLCVVTKRNASLRRRINCLDFDCTKVTIQDAACIQLVCGSLLDQADRGHKTSPTQQQNTQ